MAIEIDIVYDLAIILVASGLAAFIFDRLKQPLVLGYVIAGIIIGPYTPPFSLVSRLDLLHAMANIGVILLLFGLGLEFPLSKLRSIGKVSVGVAFIEIAVMFVVSYGLGLVLGLSLLDSAFLGTALASSSTAIIAKVLSDMGKLQERSASIMLGVLVVEDLVVVVLLALLQSYISAGSLSPTVIGWEVLKIALFIGGALAVGSLVVPRMIDRVAAIRRPEILVLTSVGLVFGLAFIGNLLGFSFAIGAFIMGTLVAAARSVKRVTHVTLHLKDIFGAIFFVSVGALIDFGQLWSFLLPAVLITVGMFGGKLLGVGLGTRLFGYDRTTSLKVGLGMAQIGEFAFIVMQVGLASGVIATMLYPAIGVAVLITTFLTPYLIKAGYGIKEQHPVTPSRT